MDAIDRIRAFNRLYTRRLGLIGQDYLSSGLGLTEMRILHDLDQDAPCRAKALADGLGLDEGYLSRVLRDFERRGWLERAVAAGDRRARDLRLTDAGRARVREAQAASRAAIAATLPPARAEALAATLEVAAAHLSPQAPRLTDLAPGDAGWIIARHAQLYAEDDGFDASFEALVCDIVAGFLRGHDPVRERGWIARRGTLPVGSIFCVRDPDPSGEVAKLRLFLIEKTERGSGLAQTMLTACMGFAREAGYKRLRLWTHESHCAACRLYARNGFAMGMSRSVRSFGQDLVEQVWERAL